MKNTCLQVIMATIWVALLVTPGVTQQGYVDTPRGAARVALTPTATPGVEVGQVGNISNDEVNADESDDFGDFEPAGQVVAAAERGPRGPQGPEGQPGLRGKSGLRGQHGLRGVQGKRGLRGPAGKKANSVGIYRHVKTWNPASCSRVDAKANQAFEKSKAYTDGALSVNKKSVSVAPATKASDKDKSNWNWWWLLWPLLILLLLGFLIWLGQLGVWSRLRGLFRPKATPIATNTADCRAFGLRQDSAEIEIVSTGRSCIEVKKGVAFSNDEDWSEVVPGEKLTVSQDIGAPIRFIVTCHNTAGLPVKTNSIIIKDNFVSSLSQPYRITKGSFYTGGEKLGNMSQKDIDLIAQGKNFPLSRYIDELPANGDFKFVYEAEIIQDKNHLIPSQESPSPAQFTAESSVDIVNGAKVANDLKTAHRANKKAKKAKKADDVIERLVAPPMVSDEEAIDSAAPPNFEAVAQDAANVAANNK